MMNELACHRHADSPHATGRNAKRRPHTPKNALDGYLSFWRYSRRALALVWSTHRGLTDRRSAC